MMDTLRIRHKTGDPVDGVAGYLHRDRLGSVRVMTGADGASDKEVTYRPFGEAVAFVNDSATLPKTKGFITLSGFDADAGLFGWGCTSSKSKQFWLCWGRANARWCTRICNI
nr:hypothetical protein [Profundibacter amoris]